MSYEPGASYTNFIQWLQTKAKGVNDVSPAIAGAYLALAGELITMRAEAIALHNGKVPAQALRPDKAEAQRTEPHDTEAI